MSSITIDDHMYSVVVQAKERGADGIEFDLEFCKDGTCVVFHDDTVDRTTDGTGCLRNFTYDELCKLDASAKHSKK